MLRRNLTVNEMIERGFLAPDAPQPQFTEEEIKQLTAAGIVLQDGTYSIDYSWWFFTQKHIAYISLEIELLYAYFLAVSISAGAVILATFIFTSYLQSDTKITANFWIGLISAFVGAGLNLISDLLQCVAVSEAEDMKSSASITTQLDAAIKKGELQPSQKNLIWYASFAGQCFAFFTAWLIGASADAITVAYLTTNMIARYVLGGFIVPFGALLYVMAFNKKITEHMIALTSFCKGFALILQEKTKGIEFLRRIFINSLNRGIGFGYIALTIAEEMANANPKNPDVAAYVIVDIVCNIIVTLFSRSLPSYKTLLYNAEQRRNEINAILTALNATKAQANNVMPAQDEAATMLSPLLESDEADAENGLARNQNDAVLVTEESKLASIKTIVSPNDPLSKKQLQFVLKIAKQKQNEPSKTFAPDTDEQNAVVSGALFIPSEEQINKVILELYKLTAEQKQILHVSQWQTPWNVGMALTFAIPVGYFTANITTLIAGESLPFYYAYLAGGIAAAPFLVHNIAARRLLDPETAALKAVDKGEQQLLATYVENSTFAHRYEELRKEPKIQNIAYLFSRGGRCARWVSNIGFISKLAKLFADNDWTAAWSHTDIFMLNLMIGTLAFEADGPVFDEINTDTLAKHWVRAEYAFAWAKSTGATTRTMLNAFFHRTDEELIYMCKTAEFKHPAQNVEASQGVVHSSSSLRDWCGFNSSSSVKAQVATRPATPATPAS